MADQIPMTVILIISYLVYAAQIFLLSIYYPGVMAKRVRYVLDNYPPEDYPKLYPAGYAAVAGARGRKLTLYHRYNQLVALVGFFTLAAMIAGGYRPDMKGGDEIFVILYFLLQTVPFIAMSFTEFRHYRQMHEAFTSSRRTADLRPRRLFDFVAPGYCLAAVLLLVAWGVFYVSAAGPISAWQVENYATLTLIFGMNVAYAVIIRSYLTGKKQDPYQAYPDQLRTIESTIKVFVISSIMISLFLILTQGADQFDFEVFDPPLTSLYVQLCVIMGIGLTFRMRRVEDIDFEVYRKDAPAA